MRSLQKFYTMILMLTGLAACGPLTPMAVTQPPQATSSAPGTQGSFQTSWLTFEDPALDVSLRYPQNWQAQTALPTGTRISGADGFFELTSRVQPPSRFEQIETWCILAANDPSLSASFGPHPTILVGNRWNPAPYAEIGRGCVVLPSDPAGTQAVLYRRSSLPETSQQILILRADASHFGDIIANLKFPDAGPASPTDSILCKESPTSTQTSTRQVGEFVLHEYALAEAGCDPLNDFELFQSRVKGLQLGPQNTPPGQASEYGVELSNRKLAAFHYRLVTHPTNPPSYDLLKGDEMVLAGITYFGGVSVNAAGDDFILWVQQSPRIISEVRLNAVRTLAGQEQGFNTTWLGPNLIRFGVSPDWIEISSNDKLIQSFNAARSGPTGTPTRQFWSWQDHWFVKVADVLMQDGEILNLRLGYEEIFAWQVLDEQPFFMMRKGPSYGIVYAGKELPVQYEDILHGELCCDLNSYQITQLANGLQFYARRDGVWMLVNIQKVP